MDAINKGCGDSRKKTWKALKNIWPQSNKRSGIESVNDITDNKGMANAMNSHFARIGDKLASKFNDPILESFPPSQPPIMNLGATSFETVK